ncbi:hypothetical protein [Streptomyces lincolnensis]|uniref:hypothetical protein n=1 Tax=Streptomyces lincolnensis TaxID=1915 RepID=UPI0037D7BC22
MKRSVPTGGLPALVLALALVSGCSGGTHPRAAVTHGATAGAGVASPAQTPTSPDRLPDPVQSPIPVGSKTLYTGSGHGAGGVTLPASAGKASSITVMWTCAGTAKFDIVAAGKVLAGSQCGDGSGVFTAKVPHANMRELAWKFSTANSVIWRIAITQPPGN